MYCLAFNYGLKITTFKYPLGFDIFKRLSRFDQICDQVTIATISGVIRNKECEQVLQISSELVGFVVINLLQEGIVLIKYAAIFHVEESLIFAPKDIKMTI